MKCLVRYTSFVLIVAILLATPVNAAEYPDQTASPYASNFFSMTSTYLTRVSSTKFKVCYDICAVGTMDILGVSMIKVQRSSDGTNWSTMQTFTMDLTEDMVDYNTGAHFGYISYYGTPGYHYRAYVCFYAKDGANIGELYRYTDSMIL